MTEGIPASSSTTVLTKEEATPVRKYSPRKMETAREKTKGITRARKDVEERADEEGQGAEPRGYGVPDGPRRKVKPFRAMAGIDATKKETKTAARRRRTPTPGTWRSRLKAASDMTVREPRTAPE